MSEVEELRAEVERLRGPFRCCEHCADDVVHDVEPNQHEVSCQICDAVLTRRAEAAEEARDEFERAYVGEREDRVAAEARLRAVEALAERWAEHGAGHPDYPDERPVMFWSAAASHLRAALASASPAVSDGEGWDPVGFAMRFDREEWGVIIDALIQHRGHAEQRKAVNSESTSDVRADMCADLIDRLNAAASPVVAPSATEASA